MTKSLLSIVAFFAMIAASRGQTWQPMLQPTIANINSCSFINENEGWLVTDEAILKTSDGGNYWVEQPYPATPTGIQKKFKSIHFINALVGIIACENTIIGTYDPSLLSTIMMTSDGGNTWVSKDLGAADKVANDARMVDNQIGYCIGKAGSCKRTTDGGNTWQTFNYPSNSVSSGYRLSVMNYPTIYFAGIENGFLHYGSFGKSLEGGGNWTITPATPWAIRSLWFNNANEGWIGGFGNTIKRTNDGGLNWTSSTTEIDGGALDIVFTDSMAGWAVTDSGQLLQTMDGGDIWHVVYTTPNASALNSIIMTTPNGIGYAVGDSGTLLKYDPNLGITKMTIRSSLSIAPNPAGNTVEVTLLNGAAQNNTLQLSNLQGQVLKKVKYQHQTAITLSLSDLPNGTYFLQLTNGSKIIEATKLIVNH